MPKMRISLSEKAGETKGQVGLEGPLSFGLEALALAIETLCADCKVDPVEFSRDLHLFIKKDMQS